MEKEISSGAILGIVLLALFFIIGIGFGVFAIAKAEAGIPLEVEMTRAEISIDTLKYGFNALALFCKDCMASFILMLTAAILELLRRKKGLVDDRLITSTTKQNFVKQVVNSKLPMVNVPSNYTDGDQIVAVYNTDKVSLLQYIKSRHSIKSSDLHILKHGEMVSLNSKVVKSGSYYKIGDILVPRNKLALVEGSTNEDLKIYVKYRDMYKVSSGILAKDFTVVSR